MSVMYESLNKNDHWALGSGAEWCEKGGEGKPTWLVTAGEAGIPGG